MAKATTKQRRMIYALLGEGTLSPVDDGPLNVEHLTVGEASRLIAIADRRRATGVFGFGGSSTDRGPYKEGEHTTFELSDGAEVRVHNEGTRILVNMILQGITVLPHSDNSVSIAPRGRRPT